MYAEAVLTKDTGTQNFVYVTTQNSDRIYFGYI